MDRQEQEYIDIFQAEAGEYLQILNRCALRLEEKPTDRESLQEAFRVVHSLKGMAGTMGYQNIMKITHCLENILEELQAGAIVPNPSTMDIIFEGVDLLQGALQNPDQEEPRELEQAEELTLKIKEICSTATDDHGPASGPFPRPLLRLDETEKETIRLAKEKDQLIYVVAVTLKPHAPLKSVRAYMVLRCLESYGEIVATAPSEQDLEDENFNHFFQVVLAAGQPLGLGLREELLNITDVEEASYTPWEELKAAETAVKPGSDPANREGGGAFHQGLVEKMVRVETAKLDQLVNLVGEMVVARTRVLELGRGHSEELDHLLEQLTQSITNLQETSMKLRMVPIKQVFDRFPRMVRDISRSRGKRVRLQITGEQTELDRSIVNRLADPLVHLIRNAIDHGIEPETEREARGKNREGTILLQAFHEGNNIVIQVEDDGAGIDPEVIKRKAIDKGVISPEAAAGLTGQGVLNLIFASGLSTSSAVTDVSGRGVGMDAVKTSIEALHGSIQIESRLSEMTRFTLRLPLTLAIINSLLVKSARQVLAIPIEGIRENVMLEPSQVKSVQENKVVNLRGEVICLHRLSRLLGFPDHDNSEPSAFPVVIVEAGGKKAGLIVEELIGQQEIMIKSLGHYLKGLKGIAGATILGDGRVTLIVDVVSLLP
ncbi:MAG: chemotaxis protein CheA [Firmicutes bacterium]|nr:chemotaxis protein CheA [Bacillota bacterium]